MSLTAQQTAKGATVVSAIAAGASWLPLLTSWLQLIAIVIAIVAGVYAIRVHQKNLKK